MVVPTPKSGILIKTYESTVNIVQLYNLANLRKWKNKYTIQFLKAESILWNLYYIDIWCTHFALLCQTKLQAGKARQN